MISANQTRGRLPDAAQPRTRAAVRLPSRSEVLVQSARHDGQATRLRDISIHGCNLVHGAQNFRAGMFISLHLLEGLSVHAIVRWVRGDSCGVEFLRPIATADADRISELIWAG